MGAIEPFGGEVAFENFPLFVDVNVLQAADQGDPGAFDSSDGLSATVKAGLDAGLRLILEARSQLFKPESGNFAEQPEPHSGEWRGPDAAQWCCLAAVTGGPTPASTQAGSCWPRTGRAAENGGQTATTAHNGKVELGLSARPLVSIHTGVLSEVILSSALSRLLLLLFTSVMALVRQLLEAVVRLRRNLLPPGTAGKCAWR